MKSARAGGERFCFRAMYGKRGNAFMYRKGYAASVSQLSPAYGCAIFPVFRTADWEQKIRCESRRRFIQSFLK